MGCILIMTGGVVLKARFNFIEVLTCNRSDKNQPF